MPLFEHHDGPPRWVRYGGTSCGAMCREGVALLASLVHLGHRVQGPVFVFRRVLGVDVVERGQPEVVPIGGDFYGVDSGWSWYARESEEKSLSLAGLRQR